MAPFLLRVPEVTAPCRRGGIVSAEGIGMQPLQLPASKAASRAGQAPSCSCFAGIHGGTSSIIPGLTRSTEPVRASSEQKVMAGTGKRAAYFQSDLLTWVLSWLVSHAIYLPTSQFFLSALFLFCGENCSPLRSLILCTVNGK